MPRYQYLALTKDGREFRGLFVATDEHDLAAKLIEQGLSLSSCVIEAKEASEATEVAKVVPPPKRKPIWSLPPTEPRQWIFWGCILSLGIGIGTWRAYRQWNPVITYDVVDERMSHVKPGMLRTEAERFLGKPEIAGCVPRRSCYPMPGQKAIEVEYDESGGLASAENRVRTLRAIRGTRR